MPRIIFRHLFAETAKTWIIISAVLIFLALGVGLSQYIAAAAAGRVPVDTVAELAGLSIIGNLDIVMPLSVLLAIMLVVGRLCRDNEMAALMAGGAGLGTIYRPFITLAALVALFAGTMSIFVAPHAQRQVNRLSAESAANALQAIKTGRFNTFSDGDITFYAAKRDKDGRLRDVFVRAIQKSNGQSDQILLTADRARQSIDENHAVTLVLDDGWRYEGRPGDADYRIIHFKEHGVLVSQPDVAKPNDNDAKTTLELIRHNSGHSVAKWQTRFSVPLSIFILALIALPIGQVPPRAGRYGRMIVGILFFVMYLNLVRLSGEAIKNDILPGIIGQWWIHIVVLGFALYLIARENGWPRRKQRKARS